MLIFQEKQFTHHCAGDVIKIIDFYLTRSRSEKEQSWLGLWLSRGQMSQLVSPEEGQPVGLVVSGHLGGCPLVGYSRTSLVSPLWW